MENYNTNFENKKICLITITHGISPTSMPYNEFVLYRLNHYSAEKQICIIPFEKEVNAKIQYPSSVEIYRCNNSFLYLHKIVKSLIKKYTSQNYKVVFHIHEGKSVVFFTLATLNRYRKNVIYTLHSTFSNYAFHNKIFAIFSTIFSQKVICCGKSSYNHFPKLLLKIYPSKVSFIQNGLDTERISVFYNKVSKNYDFAKRTVKLIYVARLVKLKQHEILFNTLKLLPHKFQLVLVGIGKREKELRILSKNLGLENRIKFLGQQSREEVYRLFQESDVFVSSSAYEGLPIAVLEAMACGLPCILSDIEQHREIAMKCPNLIFTENNPSSWAESIKSLIVNPNLKEIGTKNHNDVYKSFSLENMHKNYSKIYEEVTNL